MTTTMQAPTRTTIQGAPELPQVNLLPPEVRAGRALGRLKVWMGISLLAILLGIGIIFVWATWEAKQADQDLAEVLDTNDALMSQQNQYAEVPQVLGEIADLSDARTYAMSSDTVWQPYLAAVAAVSPTQVSIDNLTVSQSTAWSNGASAQNDPLSTPGTIGVVSLSGRSATIPDTAAWQDGLSAIPGVVDVDVSAVALGSDPNSVFYQVTATMKITTEALSGRFSGEEG